MAIRRRGFWSKFGIFLLGAIFGIIAFVSGVGLYGYNFYKKKTLGDISKMLGWQSLLEEADAETKNLTLKDIFSGSAKLTSLVEGWSIADIEKALKIKGIPNEIGGIDITALKNTAFKDISGETIFDNVKLKDLPDKYATAYPFLTGFNENYQMDVYSYVKLSKADYLEKAEYSVLTPYARKSVIEGTIEDNWYEVISNINSYEGEVYVKVKGLQDCYLLDAIAVIQDNFSFDNHSLRDFELKFGITLGRYNSSTNSVEYNSVVEKILDVEINSFDTEIESVVKNIKLGEVLEISGSSPRFLQTYKDYTLEELELELKGELELNKLLDVEEGSILKKLSYKRYTEEEANLYNAENPLSPQVKMGDIMYKDSAGNLVSDGTGTAVNTTINEISGQIGFLKLSEVLTIDGNSQKILIDNKDTLICNLESELENLTLVDVLAVPSGGILEVLSRRKYTQNDVDNGVSGAVLGEYQMQGTNYTPTKIDELEGQIELLMIDDVLDIDGNSPLVLRALSGTLIKNLEEKCQTLTLGNVVEVTSSSPKILQTLKEVNISSLGDRISILTLEDVLDIDENSPNVIKALKTTNINELAEKCNQLTLGEVMVIDENSPTFLQTNKNKTLTEIQEIFTNALISDVVEVAPGSILEVLSRRKYTQNDVENGVSGAVLGEYQMDGASYVQTKISEIDTQIDMLKMGEILAIDENSPKILQTISSTMLSDLTTKFNSLMLSEVIDISYASDGVTPIGIWRYVIPEGESDISLITLNEGIDGACARLTSATIGTLVEDGIITIDESAFSGNEARLNSFKALTLQQLIDFATNAFASGLLG